MPPASTPEPDAAAPAPGGGALTVAEVLDLPSLRRGMPVVAAGEARLGRDVRWVHAGEVEHIASQLRGGELLLTTGMGLGRGAAEQQRYVARLAARGLAALVVELGTSHAELPPALVHAAEEHGLPLVALRREVPFVAVTEEVHARIVNGQYALLRRGDELQRDLTRALLDGGGVPDVLRLVAAALGNPVFLADGDGGLLSHAAGPADDADALDAWSAGRGAVAGDDAGLAAVVAMPAAQAPGRLSVLPVAAPLHPLSATALERAAGTVALCLLRTRQEEELVQRERADLLDALAEGRTPGERAQAQAAAIGFRPPVGLLVPLAADGPPATTAAGWAAVLRDVRREVDASGAAVLVGGRSRVGRLLALVAVPEAAERGERAGRLAAAVGVAAARRLDGAEVVVVVGSPVPWARAGAERRRPAQAAASAVDRPPPPAPWHDADALELQRLLWHWRDDDELAAFAHRRLGPLLEHDRRRKHRLLPTLEALCAHGWHKAEAARALHLNRQALYSRLHRIEELLGVDLADAEQTLQLHLALRALPHVGEPGAPRRG